MRYALIYMFLFGYIAKAQDVIGQPGGGERPVNSLPATCTPGVSANVSLISSPYGLYWCSAINTWSQSTGGALSSPVTSPSVLQFGTFAAPVDLILSGPNPLVFDIRAYGARAITAQIPTTATCTNTSQSYSVTSAANYIIGDGVTIYNCGPTVQAATPSAPTVSSGASTTFTGFDTPLVVSSGGGLTFNYKLVSRDGNGIVGLNIGSGVTYGGLTLPSAVATVSNGNPLGQQTISVTSIVTAGTAMTLTLASAGPPNGTKVRYTGNATTTLNTYGQIISGGGTTSITINMPYWSNGITSSGGSLIYFNANQLTWTNQTNAVQQIICASRPSDAGAYHVIGLSPINSTTFNDWGATITVAPGQLPSYITDSTCTAGASTNDYVSGTITNITGNTITLSTAASQNTTGTMNLDAMPALLAAQTAAATGSTRFQTPVYIPCLKYVGASYYFPIMSSGSLSTLMGANGLVQCGLIHAYETISGTGLWQGWQNDVAISGSGPTIFSYGAWPILYAPVFISVYNVNFACNGVNGLAIQASFPGGSGQNSYFEELNFGCSGYSPTEILDFSGFNQTFKHITGSSGPGDTPSFFDTTWWAPLYIDGASTAEVDDEYRFGTGMAIRNTSGQTQTLKVSKFYIQGPIEPSITTSCGPGNEMVFDIGQQNDTAPQPFLSIDGNCPTFVFGQGWYGGVNVPIAGTYFGTTASAYGSILNLGGISFPNFIIPWFLTPNIGSTSVSSSGNMGTGFTPLNAPAFSDNFNRANGAIGSNWTVNSGGFNISGNAVVGTVAGINQAVYSGQYLPTPYGQFAGVLIVSPPTFGLNGVILNQASGATTGYQCGASSTNLTIFQLPGAGARATTAYTLAAGDVIFGTLTLVSGGGLFTCTVIPGNGSSPVSINYTDATISTITGLPGIGSANNNGSLDNWFGGGIPYGGSIFTNENSWYQPQHFGPITVGSTIQFTGTTFANLGTPVNGTVTFCPDCTIANPCAGSGTGALAKRLNSVWVCN